MHHTLLKPLEGWKAINFKPLMNCNVVYVITLAILVTTLLGQSLWLPREGGGTSK